MHDSLYYSWGFESLFSLEDMTVNRVSTGKRQDNDYPFEKLNECPCTKESCHKPKFASLMKTKLVFLNKIVMGYLHIDNLYKNQVILLFKECYAMEKIHGTSAHITWKFEEDRIIFFTGENHNVFLALFDEDHLRACFEAIFPDQDATIFGEHYAGKCQGMSHTYGKISKFIGFDVKVGNVWLNVPNAEDVCKQFDIEFVHYERIPTILELLDLEMNKPSVQAVRNGITEQKKREGIVLRPLEEMRGNNGERVICKYKPEEEMETKTKREVSPEQLKVLSDAKEIAEEWVTNKRLEHVLQKFPEGTSMESMGDIIKAMIDDVYREGRGEIVESKEVGKAIGGVTVKLFKAKLQSTLK